MNLTIHTDGFEGFKKRSLERAKKLTRGERVATSRGLTFESPKQIRYRHFVVAGDRLEDS